MQMSTSTDHVVFIMVDFGNGKENNFLLLFLLHITLCGVYRRGVYCLSFKALWCSRFINLF